MAADFRERARSVLKLALLAVVLFVIAWTAVVFFEVRAQSLRDETRPADAIVVFGAAEYVGRPSPIFRARLDHAFTLFARGIAPLVITTGGAGEDQKFSEGGVGRDYLIARGVPEGSIIAETRSGDTSESAVRVANILRANGLHTCVAVSDGYHIFRIKRMLEREGIEVYGAPRPQSHPSSARQRFESLLRETISYGFWKLNLDLR